MKEKVDRVREFMSELGEKRRRPRCPACLKRIEEDDRVQKVNGREHHYHCTAFSPRYHDDV